jgi:hypothetical protein
MHRSGPRSSSIISLSAPGAATASACMNNPPTRIHAMPAQDNPQLKVNSRFPEGHAAAAPRDRPPSDAGVHPGGTCASPPGHGSHGRGCGILGSYELRLIYGRRKHLPNVHTAGWRRVFREARQLVASARGCAGDFRGRFNSRPVARSPSVSPAPGRQEIVSARRHLLPGRTRANSRAHESQDLRLHLDRAA